MSTNIKTALLSVSDKTNLVAFAKFLAERGVKLIATGGTCAALRDAGLDVREVSEVTGFPEILRGRVKTLHPMIHAGLLADRTREDDRESLAQSGAEGIDLVVVNLYPFEKVAGNHWEVDAADFDHVIENIDIGGPCMIRAAAKNHKNVAVVTSPAQYDTVQAEIAATGGVQPETRRQLALAAFRKTAAYDAAITTWFDHQQSLAESNAGADAAQTPMPEVFVKRYDKRFDLRYGENPHQRAAFYAEMAPHRATIAAGQLVRGESVSYNNILDCDAALGLAGEFAEPCCIVIKHTNPCGAAIAADCAAAFDVAKAADPVSAYGGILGFNRAVDAKLAEFITAKGQFFECVVAPSFTDEALAVFDGKSAWVARLRLIAVNENATDPAAILTPDRPRHDAIVRGIEGGVLVQSPDAVLFAPEGGITAGDVWTVATANAPTDTQSRDLKFAWAVCKHVKSNAIVLVKDGVAIGVGAGQMSRVEAVELAVKRAGGAEKVAGAVLASDAFFPFPDGPEAAIAAGVSAIVQPGGSKRDADVIAVCNAHQVPMVFTAMRHFRH